jgi:peptidoglycan/xylan/chitin deacetylase (PgdA/CDA1 family)
MGGRRLILAYHNVVPDDQSGRGDRSLHLPISTFLRQLDLLQQHCEVRTLGEILAKSPLAGGPHVAITFDDAYRGAVELALPELERRGLPSTLFVSPGLLGSRSFWWDELALPGEGLPERDRRRALDDQAGRSEQIRLHMPVTAANPLPVWYGCATQEQIHGLAALTRLTLGSHTWNHPNLTRLSGADLAEELASPLGWLRGLGLPVVPVLAYPYGLHSTKVAEEAHKAGYQAALLVDGGWIPLSDNRSWAVPRYNVPAGLSADGFVLRLSGLMFTRGTSPS